MIPSRSGILAEAISITFTSLQQRQSVSLASILQCPHLHQSRFPILICNKLAAEASVQLPPKVFCKKGVLENFSSFTGKHLCWSLYLIKLQVFRPATLLKRLQHRYFPVKFTKFLRTLILKNIYQRLFLQFLSHVTCVGVSS